MIFVSCKGQEFHLLYGELQQRIGTRWLVRHSQKISCTEKYIFSISLIESLFLYDVSFV
jgi:hypothetical protein